MYLVFYTKALISIKELLASPYTLSYFDPTANK